MPVATTASRIESTRDIALEVQECCVCKSSTSAQIASGVDFEYGTTAHEFRAVRCVQCGLIYLNPRPASSELARIYPPTYHAFQFSEENFGLAYRVRRWLEARRLLSCAGPLRAGSRILDVGCGDGFHLRLLTEFGDKSWRAEGLDTSEPAVIAARRAGLNVHLGSIESGALPERTFDVVFLIATIEHVPDPRTLLAAVFRVLRPGGRVIVVTDNTATADFRIFGRRHWGGYHFPRHWNLFNRKNLEKLSLSIGFEPVKIETIVSPVNWVYSIRNRLQDWGAPRFLYQQFSLSTPIPLAIFTAVDFGFHAFGHGALLRATLRRPL